MARLFDDVDPHDVAYERLDLLVLHRLTLQGVEHLLDEQRRREDLDRAGGRAKEIAQRGALRPGP